MTNLRYFCIWSCDSLGKDPSFALVNAFQRKPYFPRIVQPSLLWVMAHAVIKIFFILEKMTKLFYSTL